MSNVIYVPWSGAEANEFLEKSRQWQDSDNSGRSKHKRDWVLTQYGQNGLAKIKRGSTIYVRGHGAPGFHSLAPVDDGNGLIDYRTVCDRMIADGLYKSFVGTIKFSCCDSGVPTLGSQSFAAKFSQHLRLSKGYFLVSVVGYLGAVDSHYNDQGGKNNHRYVTFFGKETKSKFAQVRF